MVLKFGLNIDENANKKVTYVTTFGMVESVRTTAYKHGIYILYYILPIMFCYSDKPSPRKSSPGAFCIRENI